MEINLLKQLLVDQKKTFLRREYLIDRELEEDYESLIKAKQSIVVSGVRRSGKSSFLKLLCRHLLDKKGVTDSNIFYVNFDDELFVNFKNKDFNSLLAAFYEISKVKKGKVYCFFDEIQNVKYWEKWVNKLNESGEHKIFITGSNSSLLSGEIATSLTGRSYTLEIFPFSFREYLCYKKISLPKSLLTTKEKSAYKRYFDEYLTNGGFPESIGAELNILEEYYKNIIYKDIIARHGIKNIADFRETSLFLMSNISGLMTYRGIAKNIEGMESSITAKNYLTYLKDAYLLFSVKKLDSSIRKQAVNPFKVYGIDNGMIQSVSYSISKNYCKLYENLVFLSLRRKRGEDIYYYKNNFETDFITMQKKKVNNVIQVCYDVGSKKTAEREERALLESLEILGVKKGLILNNYIEKEKVISGKKIQYLPLWRWMLYG